MMRKRAKNPTLETVVDALREQAAAVQAMQAQIAALQPQPRQDDRGDEQPTLRAVGTTPRGRKPTKTNSLGERVEELLLESPRTVKELVSATGRPEAEVREVLDGARGAGKLRNVGTEDLPMFAWVIGEASPAARMDYIVRLVGRRPLTWPELLLVTGAPKSVLSGDLQRLEYRERRIVNLSGDPKRKLYWAGPARLMRALATDEEPGEVAQ